MESRFKVIAGCTFKQLPLWWKILIEQIKIFMVTLFQAKTHLMLTEIPQSILTNFWPIFPFCTP